MIAATRYPAFSRNFEDEQDYANAAVSVARKGTPLDLSPILRWNPQHKQNKPRCKTLVVGFGASGASFAQKCFGLAAGDADWIGTVVLPGALACGTSGASSSDATSTTVGLGDSLDPADPLNSACNIFCKNETWVGEWAGGGSVKEKKKENRELTGNGWRSNGGDNERGVSINGGENESEVSRDGGDNKTDPSSNGDGDQNGTNTADRPCRSQTLSVPVAKNDNEGGGAGVTADVLVVLCGYCVPQRQADAWAKTLLEGIDAEVVVALTAVTAEPGRSEVWQGARLLATAEAEEREDCLKMSEGFQPLRTPTMLSGASAALVSYCQRHGRAAMCFAVAELRGRKALPQQLRQFGGGDSCSGVGSLLLEERSFSSTRKALGVVAGAAMVSMGDGGGGRGGSTADMDMDALDGVPSGLYV